MPSFESIAVRRKLELHRLFGWGALLAGLMPILIMMIGGGIFGMVKPVWWSWFPGASWGAAFVLVLAALVARHRAAGKPGQLDIEEGALRVTRAGGSVTMARSAVENGTVTPLAAGALVTLEGQGREIALKTPSLRDAGALLSRLGLDPARRRLVTRLQAGVGRIVGGVGLVFGLSALAAAIASDPRNMPQGIGFYWLAAAVPAFFAWFFGTRPPAITIGADGVRLRRALRSTFVPFGGLAAARREGTRLVLERRDGTFERVRLPAGNDAAIDAVLWRIELGISAHANEDDEVRRALLERGGRPLAAWRQRLEELAAGDAGYRRQPLSPSDLEAILLEPATTPEQRLGAALALRGARAEGAATKIRFAADQCASPRLRIALERVAEEREADEDLEQATAEALEADA